MVVVQLRRLARCMTEAGGLAGRALLDYRGLVRRDTELVAGGGQRSGPAG